MAKGKWEEQKKAKLLRTEGKSVKEIAEILGVSKGSISRWVRNVILTEEQKLILQERNPIYNNQIRGSSVVQKKYLDQRKEYQKEGAELARKQDPKFIAGCMLYWGEGNKDKNSLGITNCDKNFIRFFISFVKSFFELEEKEIKINIAAYSGNKTALEIEKYWKEAIGLSDESITITVKFDSDKRPNSGKKVKYPYGICKVRVNRTDIVQQVYGAIQEIGEFQNEKWLG